MGCRTCLMSCVMLGRRCPFAAPRKLVAPRACPRVALGIISYVLIEEPTQLSVDLTEFRGGLLHRIIMEWFGWTGP